MILKRFFYLFVLSLVGKPALAQSETMLTGKIVNSAGVNIPGCQVKVCDCEKRDSSDRDGVYRIYLKPGKYELQVFRSGALLRRRVVEIPPVEFYEVDFAVTDAR